MSVKNKTNKNYKRSQKGRSMVEMLGVLAIIGVLSVGGVYGYGVAMKKHKANELLHQASMLATTISAQAMTNNGTLPSTITSFGNSSYGTFSTSATDALDGKGFSITIENVDSGACTQLEKMAGGMVRDVDCDESGNATITYYKNLATTEAEGEKSPTGEETVECYPACSTGQECIGGVCAKVSACTDECFYLDQDDGDFPSIGCTKNSDCDEWCDKNSHEKCYCNVWDYSESSCYPSLEGVCAPAQTRSNIKGGYIASYNGMSWWGAVNFCKAHNASMVSLFELGIESGYQNTGECNNSGCKGDNFTWTKLIEDIDESHYWVKDGRTCDDNGENCTIENNAAKSCLAFQIYSDEETVTYGYRSEFNDALCKK